MYMVKFVKTLNEKQSCDNEINLKLNGVADVDET